MDILYSTIADSAITRTLLWHNYASNCMEVDTTTKLTLQIQGVKTDRELQCHQTRLPNETTKHPYASVW